jgi:hypothetical protein
VPNPFQIENQVLLLISLALLAVKAFALADASVRKSNVFVAADKQTKPLWLILLGLALVAQVLIPSPIHIINFVGTVAALVYLVDVRPVVRSLTRR